MTSAVSPLPDRAAMSMQEVADQLGICEMTVRRAIHDGRLRAIKIGRRTVVPTAELQAIVDGRKAW